MNPEVPLQAMHATYNRLTNQTLRFKPFERLWFDFQHAGYSSADLELVLTYMQRRNRKGGFEISLRLDRLLDDLARFESYRGEADLEARNKAARARAWKPTAGEKARAAMCGHAPVPPAKEPVLARDAVIAGLRQLQTSIQTP